MPSQIPPGRLRRTMGRELWQAPLPFGGDGWKMTRKDFTGSVIVSVARWEDGLEWVHASIAYGEEMPTYDDLVLLRSAVWGDDGWAVQIFAPPSDHISIHPNALHIWGRLDGKRAHPNFGRHGTI